MERLPGFRDFYPEPLPQPDLWSAEARQYIFEKWRAAARRYGFREYDGPPLEALELFTTKSGEEIVGQLYNFRDKGQREVSLRPEMTPTLARMIAAHERSYKKPIKWFALPQLFRYERQQKGRLREHFQFNADIVGEGDPGADAELIALLIDTLRSFGLTAEDFVVRLSSRNAWHDFFSAQHGEGAAEYAFYQIIDKLEREGPESSGPKLAALGLSIEEVQAFIGQAKPTAELRQILENLEARGMREYAKVDYGVIRGLAYYTGVVFEAFDIRGEFRAIAGGGRYDNLVKLQQRQSQSPRLGLRHGGRGAARTAQGSRAPAQIRRVAGCLLPYRGPGLARSFPQSDSGITFRRPGGGLQPDSREIRQAIQTRPGVERRLLAKAGPLPRRRIARQDQEPQDPRGEECADGAGCGPGARLCRWLRQWK